MIKSAGRKFPGGLNSFAANFCFCHGFLQINRSFHEHVQTTAQVHANSTLNSVRTCNSLGNLTKTSVFDLGPEITMGKTVFDRLIKMKR